MRHCPPRLFCLFMVLALAGTTSVMANNETTTPPPSLPGLLSSFTGSKILLIGILDSDLTIITKDTSPLVYDVPMAKFVDGKFDLYGLAPVQLSSKWPALSSNANFTSTLQGSDVPPQTIFLKLESEKFVYVFNSYLSKIFVILETITLAINPPSASYQEYKFTDDLMLTRAHFISSTEQNVFFNLAVYPGNPHQLTKYGYQGAAGFNVTSNSVICKQMGTNGTEMIVFKDPKNSIDCNPTDWDIQNGGFVAQNRFHLFSHDTVYIFEYTGAGGSDPAGVPVKTIKLGDFFVSITPTTTTTHSHKSSTRKAGWSTSKIVSVVGLVVLALMLIALAVMWFKCIKPLHKDLEMSKSSKGPVAGQFQAQVQAQSQAQSSQFPKFQNSSGQAASNTSGYKKPMGALSLLAMQNGQSSVVMSSTNNQPKMEHQEPKPEPTPEQLPYSDCSTQPAKRVSSKTEKEIKLEKMQKQKDGHKSSSDEEVPADSTEKEALPESEVARLAEAEAQKKMKNKTNRPESRQKVSPKQGGGSTSKQKRGKQTLKAKLAKLAAKHSKGGKASKGSVASRKPTTKKSLRKMATKGGKATSKASKGSNRKF